jgi:CheY-like chemotaxis protein
MPSALQGLRLLIVEDEPDSRELLRIVLQMHGAQVECVTCFYEAIEQLEQSDFDAILSNVRLPDGESYSSIREWRQRETKLGRTMIPAIAVTASDRDVNRPKAIDAGFQDWISKPIEPDKIVQAVVNAVRQTP